MTVETELRIAALERRLASGRQLLLALVGIRLRSVSDPESRRHLAWLSDVIAAMGLLDRRMSLDGPINFAAYLEDAAGLWRRTSAGRGVRIDVRAGEAALPEGSAMALAIVLHELLSNAVRHAFPDGARGSIAVAYSPASDGVSLVVRDSGVGAETLRFGDGLNLVEGLVQHLSGQMTIETAEGEGVGVRIRLPIEPSPTH